MTHLTNAHDVPGPLLTTGALVLAGIVLYGVLFTLAAIHAHRCDKAEEEA